MGLLSRAGSKFAEKPPCEVLDEMGKALKERLERLPHTQSTPHAVLSLLKAYGGFQAGVCLSLKNGTYAGYASVGFGAETITISQTELWPPAKARGGCFRLAAPPGNGRKDWTYWGFPLGPAAAAGPWKTVLILGASEASQFNPGFIAAILDTVSGKMVLPKAPGGDPASRSPAERTKAAPVKPSPGSAPFAPAQTDAIQTAIIRFHRMHHEFNCIVLENPPGKPEGGPAGFCEKVSAIVDRAGTVVPLPSDRPLILLPILMDRELIAHRLSGTLHTTVLLSFEAHNSENALTRIDSLL